MASFLYNNFLDHCLGKDAAVGDRPDLDTNEIRGAITNGNDYSEADTHGTYDDVGAYTKDICYNSEPAIVLSTGKAIVDGAFDADDITFVGVDLLTNDVDSLVHYLSTAGVLTDDTLICFHDGFSPVTPNGGDIVVVYDALGLFTL